MRVTRVEPVVPVLSGEGSDNDPTRNGLRHGPQHEALAREFALKGGDQGQGEPSASPQPNYGLLEHSPYQLPIHPVAIELDRMRREALERAKQGPLSDGPSGTK